MTEAPTAVAIEPVVLEFNTPQGLICWMPNGAMQEDLKAIGDRSAQQLLLAKQTLTAMAAQHLFSGVHRLELVTQTLREASDEAAFLRTAGGALAFTTAERQLLLKAGANTLEPPASGQ